MRAAVVGHVEWMEFVPVEEVPRAGEIVHAERLVGGGGRRRIGRRGPALEARGLGRLLHGARQRRDGLSARGRARGAGITVHATERRRAAAARVHVRRRGRRADDHDDRPQAAPARPRRRRFPGTSSRGATASTSAPATPTRCSSRAARACVVATARELATLRQASVELDALVSSGKDEAERYHTGTDRSRAASRRDDVGRARRLGAAGRPVHRRAAAARARTTRTARGTASRPGSSFALAAGLEGLDALEFASRCGAGALAGPGVHAEAVPLPLSRERMRTAAAKRTLQGSAL